MCTYGYVGFWDHRSDPVWPKQIFHLESLRSLKFFLMKTLKTRFLSTLGFFRGFRQGLGQGPAQLGPKIGNKRFGQEFGWLDKKVLRSVWRLQLHFFECSTVLGGSKANDLAQSLPPGSNVFKNKLLQITVFLCRQKVCDHQNPKLAS